MKQLMLGNHAVARGLYEAGCVYVSSYPGTPSTEITEAAAEYPEIYTEWSPNEKVSCESAIGASMAGGRSFCAMKHVGLNVAADPLFAAAYAGVNGGMVLAVADDPGIHSSQNEQDSRHYAIAAKVPMLEPSDSEECKDFVLRAYELSERFDVPVMLRLSTRVSHSQSAVELGERKEAPLKEYRKNIQKYVLMPAMAQKLHVVVEARGARLREYAETCPLNRVEAGDGKIGVITSGACYAYVKEALPGASVLKLGLVNPLPVQLIRDFAATVEKLYVVEELDGVIEAHCRANGVDVIGKELFGWCGEIKQDIIRQKVLGTAPASAGDYPEPLPGRPPVLCPGCPHRGVFYLLNKMKLRVFGDIGCYTLGAMPPLSAMDSTLCMGASITALHGFAKVRPEAAKDSVAVIGDSTFVHSGITGLADAVYNRASSTIVILDNSITAMTGHQQNPSTGYDIHNRPAPQLDLEALCRAMGVGFVKVTDPADLAATEKTLREALDYPGVAVVITRRPCALLKGVQRRPALSVDAEKCVGCRSCMRIGCPAVSFDGKAKIDATLCVGCGLCAGLCSTESIGEAAK